MIGTRRFERFFYAYEERFAPLEVVRTPETPEQMVVGEVSDSPGWVRWRLYPWTTSTDVLGDLEQSTGLKSPAVFREFITTFHTLRLDLGFIRFPRTPIGREEKDIRRLLIGAPRDLIAKGYLPIGWYEGRGESGLYCFELAGLRSENDDAPIACVRSRGAVEQRTSIASSLKVLIDALEFHLRSDVEFLGRNRLTDETDEYFERFLAHDPETMASSGRAFWEALR